MSAHMHPKAPFRVRPKSGGRLAPLLIRLRLPLCQSLPWRLGKLSFSAQTFFFTSMMSVWRWARSAVKRWQRVRVSDAVFQKVTYPHVTPAWSPPVCACA